MFGLALASVAFLWPDLPTGIRICVVLVGSTAVAFVASGEPTRQRVRFFRWLGALEAVAILGYGIAVIPTRAEREVSAIFDETKTANIWVDTNPVMHEGSRAYLADHWDELSPLQLNGWDLPMDATAVSAYDIVESGGTLQGALVEFAGQVQVAQDFGGGEVIYQLLVPTTGLDSDNIDLVRHVPDEADRIAMVYRNSPDPQEDRRIVYVRMTPRSFFSPPSDSILLVKGVVIANGRTLRLDSKVSDVGYVAGATAEWFQLSESQPPSG